MLELEDSYNGWKHVFAAFKQVLSTASTVLDASQIPFAKTAPDIINQIIEITESARNNKKECKKLTSRTMKLISVINETCSAKSNEQSYPGIKTLFEHAEELEKMLLKVKGTIESIEKMNWFTQSLQRSDIKSRINDCNVNLDYAVELFNIKIVVNINKNVMSLLKMKEEEIVNGPGSSDPYILDREPPSTPDIFYGRKDYVETAVMHIIASHPVRLPILGPGGIGKTTVASAIIDHDDILAKFSDNRYFIRCSALSSTLQMVQMMCQIIIGPDSLNKVNPLRLLLQCLRAMPKVLVVLDNFETMWHVEDQREIKDILNRFSKIDCLTLIITMRGTAPETISWSKDEAAKELPALDPDSAQQMFRSLCQNFEDSPENNVDLSALLKQLDYVPLAISIVAQMASLESATPKQVSENILQYLKTLRDGPSDSIKASVSLSLNSYLIKNNPACIDLLRIIAYLPSGIAADYIKKMAQIQDAKRMAALLMAVGLVHKGGRMLNILSPVRFYIQQDYPLDVTDKKIIIKYYFELCNKGRFSWQFSEIRDSLAAEKANCFRVLSDALGFNRSMECANGHIERENELKNDSDVPHITVEKDNRHLQAICDYTFFLLITSILSLELFELAESDFKNCDNPSLKGDQYRIKGLILLTQCKYEEAMDSVLKAKKEFEGIGDRLGIAQCLRSMGDIARMQNRYEEASDALLKAKEEFEGIGVRLGAAQCLQSIGNIARMQGRCEEAIDALSKAKEEFEINEDRRGVAQCLQRIGDIAHIQDRYEEARDILLKAEKYFEGIGDRLGAAQCLQSLGDVARMQNMYEEARDTLSKAKKEFEAIGDRLGTAQCLQSMGDIAFMQDRYVEASDALTRAKEEFQGIGNMLGVAQCLQRIGDIAHVEDRCEEASDILWKAKEVFDGVGGRPGAAQCLRSIGNIAYMQGRYEEAKETLLKAKEVLEDVGDRVGTAQCLRSIGDIARMQGRYEEAVDVLSNAKEIFEEVGYSLGIAQCIEWLGTVAMDQGDYGDAEGMLRRALELQESTGISSEIARCRERLDKAVDRLINEKNEDPE